MTTHRNCQGMNRRDCIQLGLGTLFGGGLVGAMRSTALGSEQAIKPQAKACILVWLDGGPTHYETFDPKPDAPIEIRGELSTIPTKIPGVHFSEHMKQCASIADKFTVIRSIKHNQGNHGAGNHYMMTGTPTPIPVGCGAFVSFHPSMGSVVSRELGAPWGMPPYISMPSMSRSGGPNFLGAKYAPFIISNDPNRTDFRVRDIALPGGLTGDTFAQRNSLRESIDQMLRINDQAAGDPVNAVDEYYKQGHQLITSTEAQEAFDIGREPEHIRSKYGRSPTGQRALLARRLVEAGVPFVTLYEGGWDHHTDIFSRLKKQLPPVENAVAALISDLEERGMLDSTMVIMLGEFGRTPTINARGGRDHWSNAMSVLFAGGGAPGGQVIGATDYKGYSASERILSPENFVSTIYRKLGINPGKIVYTPEGRPTRLVSDPTSIPELMA